MSKNIINGDITSDGGGSGGGGDSSNTLYEYNFTETFYANGNSGEDDRSFAFRIYKHGTLVTMVMRGQLLSNITDVQYWLGPARVPSGLRPTNIASQVFTPRTAISDFDSDIFGTLRVRTTGDIEIWRELPPGTGTWTGLSQGWDTTSISYFI